MMTTLRFTMVAGLALAVATCGSKTPETTATTTTTAATTAPAAPGATDWTKVTAATPDGGFRIGNPDAKVKLLEFPRRSLCDDPRQICRQRQCLV